MAIATALDLAQRCVRNASLAAWIATSCSEPSLSRFAARPAMLYLHSFPALAAQSNNRLGRHPDRVSIKCAIKSFRKDWQAYMPIRHELVAHRRALGPLAASMLVSDITRSVVQILVDDASAIVRDLRQAARPPDVAELVESCDHDLATTASSLQMPSGVYVDMSDIAHATENRFGMIALGEMTILGQVVLGCLDAIDLDMRFLEAFKSSPDASQLFRASTAVDTCSVVDVLFGRQASHSGPSSRGFLDAAEAEAHSGLAPLRAVHASLPTELLQTLRRARNTVAAHVDPTATKQVETLLASFDLAEVARMASDIRAATRKSWIADPRTVTLGLHGQRASFITGVERTDLIKPYND